MKLAKVMTITTKGLYKHYRLELVFTVADTATPEQIFASYNLIGKVEKYKVSPVMPLPAALAHANKIKRQLGIC